MTYTYLGIIDGTNTLYRAFYTPSSSPIKVIDSIIYSLVHHHAFTHILIVFDSKIGDLYRESLFPEYKAQRPERPEGLTKLEEQFKEKFKQYVQYDGLDGDDVLYTLALRAVNKFNEIAIITSDKDLLQAVDPTKCLRVIDPSTKKIFERDEDVIERLLVPINRVAHFLALAGDKSDNIPGVPKIGKVKALKIISECENPADHSLIKSKLDIYDIMLKLTTLRDVGLSLPDIKPLGK